MEHNSFIHVSPKCLNNANIWARNQPSTCCKLMHESRESKIAGNPLLVSFQHESSVCRTLLRINEDLLLVQLYENNSNTIKTQKIVFTEHSKPEHLSKWISEITLPLRKFCFPVRYRNLGSFGKTMEQKNTTFHSIVNLS